MNSASLNSASLNWFELAGNWILLPPRPIAILHFLGGAFIAAAPQVTYRRLLETIAQQGYVIVATPFVNTFDHVSIAETVLWNFDRAHYALQDRYLAQRHLPIYGIGHSMGCKLHLLIGSLFEVERQGNILISFNNFAAKDSIPLMEQLSQVMESFSTNLAPEFTPSPQETNEMILRQYAISHNLLVKFSNDNLDQTRSLSGLLEDRFAQGTTIVKLKGNHLTPVTQDFNRASAPFAALNSLGQNLRQNLRQTLGQTLGQTLEDTWAIGQSFGQSSIGQWMQQGMVGEIAALEQAILDWLPNYHSGQDGLKLGRG
ncbi:MAG: DUF1350 family protein [Synechococcales bacterium]|nr:DUF1350 family protein [Synechococcales bacterium]